MAQEAVDSRENPPIRLTSPQRKPSRIEATERTSSQEGSTSLREKRGGEFSGDRAFFGKGGDIRLSGKSCPSSRSPGGKRERGGLLSTEELFSTGEEGPTLAAGRIRGKGLPLKKKRGGKRGGDLFVGEHRNCSRDINLGSKKESLPLM